MNCPQCSEKSTRRGGGSSNNSAYYACQDCNIVFSVKDGITKIVDNQELPFRDRREALRVLYKTVKDDREWFGAMTGETETLARRIFTDYLLRNRSKPVVRRNQFSFGFARRRVA